ncbi:MAG: hypothetical protein WBD55_08860 [Dehalococcoidia bacterium]
MAQIVIPAQSDSVMEGIGASKDVNFGSQLYVYHRVTYLGGTKLGWGRAIGNFDVAAFVGAEILSAKLVRSVFSITNPGKQAKLSRCAHPEWIEQQVTWNSYRNNFRWTAEGGDHDDAGPPAAITYTEPSGAGDHELLGLAPFVVDALTNRNGIVSIITRLADESPGVSTEYVWRSKEYGSSAWRLVIDYTPAAPTEAGHRSLHDTAFGSGVRPAQGAHAAQPTTGVRPARPR